MLQLQHRLSLRVISLTVILGVLTCYIIVSGMYALNRFKDDYQDVKDNHLDVLLNVISLKAQVNDVLKTTWGMFLTEDRIDIEAGMLHITDKSVWIDDSLLKLSKKTDNTADLMNLKSRLYEQTHSTYAELQKKFDLEQQLLMQYQKVENYKFLQIEKGDPKVVLIIDRIMSLLTPVVSRHLTSTKQPPISEIKLLINSVENKVTKQDFNELSALFLAEHSFVDVYQNYIKQIKTLKVLKIKNAEVSSLVASVMGETVLSVQKVLVTHLHEIEDKLTLRKFQLYFILFLYLALTSVLIFLQTDFLRRVYLIRKVIDAGYSKTQHMIPIKGRDEISEMAKAVKNYIEELLAKEQQISENNIKLQHLATHDSLTNIYNRRYFDDQLNHEHLRYLRYKEPYCLAMLDLDLFKRINDTYGHSVGDEVIIEFTRIVAQQIRNTDLFARLGGEEFAVLMTRTNQQDAVLLMERIRKMTMQTPTIVDGLKIDYTVSIGVVEVHKIDDMQDPSKQLVMADSALYNAKKTGSNKVCVYQSESAVDSL